MLLLIIKALIIKSRSTLIIINLVKLILTLNHEVVSVSLNYVRKLIPEYGCYILLACTPQTFSALSTITTISNNRFKELIKLPIISFYSLQFV